ncbi:MAG TPA: toll/interleukin-1 receptor domain-containing protein [Pyrinomonadaceae bacterium]|jgi:hypothetical protein
MNEQQPVPTAQEFKPAYEWDIFLAHPGMDLDAAKNLFSKLNPPAKVFLDDECLLPGDMWDLELSKAQRSSLISVILVTPNTEAAYYEREEIAAAIQMARSDPRTHRIVPVYLNSNQIPKNRIPYGLTLRHSLYVPETGDFTETVNKLLKTLDAMKRLEVKKDEVVAQHQIAVAKITGKNSSNAEVLAGLSEVTKFIRPILNILLGLFALIIVLLIIGIIFAPSDARGLLITVLGSFAALLLIFILWLTARALGYAQQIAQGRINGG